MSRENLSSLSLLELRQSLAAVTGMNIRQQVREAAAEVAIENLTSRLQRHEARIQGVIAAAAPPAA